MLLCTTTESYTELLEFWEKVSTQVILPKVRIEFTEMSQPTEATQPAAAPAAAVPLTAEQRDERLLAQMQKLSDRIDKQQHDIQQAMQTAVSAAVSGAVNLAMSNSFEQLSQKWQADFSSGMDTLRSELAEIRKREEEALETRFKKVETGLSDLAAAMASARISQPASSSDPTEAEGNARKKLAVGLFSDASWPQLSARSTAPSVTAGSSTGGLSRPTGSTPAGVPRGQKDTTKIWSSMFPRPLTAKAMQAHAEKALARTTAAVRAVATVRASNLNKNYYIQFSSAAAAEVFLKCMQEAPVSWIDPKRVNEAGEVPIYFKADRSFPERLMGQVMGSFYGQVNAILKHKDAARHKNITMHVSIPKGTVFAVENEDIHVLATARYVAEKQFELQPNTDGLTHFGISAEEARSIVSQTRSAMAAKAVSI